MSGLKEKRTPSHFHLAHRVSPIRGIPLWRKLMCVNRLHEQPNC